MNTSDNSSHFLSFVLPFFFWDQRDLLLLLLLSLMVLMFVLLFFVGVLANCLVSGSQAVFKVALAFATTIRTHGSWSRFS